MRIFAGIWYGNGCRCLKKNRMVQTSENNKRIAKNTLVLYIRMALIMLTSLYTSRILLQTLGFEDFGIYNVVAGIVVMFSFLNVSMSVSVQRFLSYALGQNDVEQFKKVFSVSIQIHIVIALLIAVLAEILGYRILNMLTIPLSRVEAAHWIFHFSILSFMLSVCQAPFIASIMANEKMNIYAYVSVIEVFSKLLIIYVLQINLWDDKLELYGLLLLLVSFLIALIYISYCLLSFSECRCFRKGSKRLFLNILSFSSWNLLGAFGNIIVNQGMNILLNLFFGPLINAARGIAYQVNVALMTFAYNVQSAVNPQIIKLYAAEHRSEMLDLSFRACRYCFYLLLLLSLPIFYYSDLLLGIWLEDVPEYASIFCKLVIATSLIDAMAGPLSTTMQATGRIKYYQIIVSSILLLNIPISYMLLSIISNPTLPFIVCMAISFMALIARVFFVKRTFVIERISFIKSVLYKVFPVLICVCLFGQMIYLCLKYVDITQLYSFLIFTIVTFICNVILILGIGTDRRERDFIKRKVLMLI